MPEFRIPVSVSPILLYQPVFNDYIIWSKLFATWHGFLFEYDTKSEMLSFIMAGTPALLVSTSSSNKSVVKINLNDIRNSKGGKYTIVRQAPEENRAIWYV